MYIHEKDNWTAFRWNATELTAILEEVNRKNGYTGMLIRCRLHLTKRKISSVPSWTKASFGKRLLLYHLVKDRPICWTCSLMAMKQRLLPKLGHHWLNVPKTQPYGISKTLWIRIFFGRIFPVPNDRAIPLYMTRKTSLSFFLMLPLSNKTEIITSKLFTRAGWKCVKGFCHLMLSDLKKVISHWRTCLLSIAPIWG